MEIVYFLDFHKVWVHFDIIAKKVFEKLEFFRLPIEGRE